MEVLGKRLRARKEHREAAARAEAARIEQMKASTMGGETQQKERYTWVDLPGDTPSHDAGPKCEDSPLPHTKRKPLPPTPGKTARAPEMRSQTIPRESSRHTPPTSPDAKPAVPSEKTKPLPPVPVSSREKAPLQTMAQVMEEGLKTRAKRTEQTQERPDLTNSMPPLTRTKSPPPPVSKKPTPSKKPEAPSEKPEGAANRSAIHPTPRPKPKPVVAQPSPNSPPAQDDAPTYANVHFSPPGTGSPLGDGHRGHRKPYMNVDFQGSGNEPTSVTGSVSSVGSASGTSFNDTSDPSAGIYMNVNPTRGPPVHRVRRKVPRK